MSVPKLSTANCPCNESNINTTKTDDFHFYIFRLKPSECPAAKPTYRKYRGKGHFEHISV